MSEPITVLGREELDARGRLVFRSQPRVIEDCVVGPQGQAVIEGQGFFSGDTTTLQVLAPPGSVIAEGEVVQVRGVDYKVKHVPFDYSVGRRPWLSSHRPRTVFVIERKEG